MYPHVTQFEENRRELQREAQLRRQIKRVRAEQKAEWRRNRQSSLTWLATALRPRRHSTPRRRLAEDGC